VELVCFSIKILDMNTISIFQINIHIIYDINRMIGLFDKWPYMCIKKKKKKKKPFNIEILVTVSE
jgi:hypothetical protein